MTSLSNTLSAGFVAMCIASGFGSAQAASVEAGTLTCDLHDRVNLVVYSKNRFKCSFNPLGEGPEEAYTAEIKNLGVDLEITNTEQVVWAVLAPSSDVEQGALAGRYGGVSASISAGAGLGAKALIGGLEDSFTLQPLSITGTTGVGAAVTLSGLTLTQEG